MSTQTIDYSTLTDLELNKEIARRLGYKVAQFGERYKRWLIETPEGKYWNDDYGHEHEAYEALGFATDADAALDLYDLEDSEQRAVAFEAFHRANSVEEMRRNFCIDWLKWQDAKR